MKIIKKTFSNFKNRFENKRSWQIIEPVFGALDSFLLSTNHITTGKVHLRSSNNTKSMMSWMIIALIPTLIFSIYNTGLQSLIINTPSPSFIPSFLQGLKIFLPIYLTTLIVGGLWEIIFAIKRKEEINEGFLVTSLLFPLILPPSISILQVALGISFAVVICKELFGGTGKNFINPALGGRLFLFLSFPGSMTGKNIWHYGAVSLDKIDSLTHATPLYLSKFLFNSDLILNLENYGYTWNKMFLGFIPGSIGETSALTCIIGALIIITKKIGSLRTIAGALFASLLTCFLINYLCDANDYPLSSLPFHYHLVMGGFSFGLVFMATDPVSAAATNLGKWIYGILIGFLIIMLRTFNTGFSDSVMFSILLANISAPLIDNIIIMFNIKKRLKYGRR